MVTRAMHTPHLDQFVSIPTKPYILYESSVTNLICPKLKNMQ